MNLCKYQRLYVENKQIIGTDNKGDAQRRFSQILSIWQIKYNNAQFLFPLFLSGGCWQKQFKFGFLIQSLSFPFKASSYRIVLLSASFALVSS